MNNRRAGQRPATPPGQPVANPAAHQVVRQNRQRRGLPHALQQADDVLFLQMMEKQRAHDDIDPLGPLTGQDIPNLEPGLHAQPQRRCGGSLDGERTAIDAVNLQLDACAPGPSDEAAQDIAATRGEVEHSQWPAVAPAGQLTQGRPENSRAETELVDSTQTSERVTMGALLDIGSVHQFGLQSPLG